VDPLALVKLVQLEPKRYAFGGPDELRFRVDNTEARERIAFIEALLAKLASPQPAPTAAKGGSAHGKQASTGTQRKQHHG